MGNRIDFLAHIVERRKKEVAIEEEEEQQAAERQDTAPTPAWGEFFSSSARCSSRLLCEKLFMLKNMLIYAITAGVYLES